MLETFIDQMTSITFSIFRTFGWEWKDNQVTNQDIEDHFRINSINLVNEDIDSISSGRLVAEKIYEEGRVAGIEYLLSLGSIYFDTEKEMIEEINNL